MVIATDASTFASSIIAVTYEIISRPEPPYFSGIIIPIKPNSPIFLTISEGNSSFASNLSINGSISVFENSYHISNRNMLVV